MTQPRPRPGVPAPTATTGHLCSVVTSILQLVWPPLGSDPVPVQGVSCMMARVRGTVALALTDPGFDASVLNEFRQRLIKGHAERLLFETMLTLFREQGLLKAKGCQRTDLPHVLAAPQTLNRRKYVGETLRHARN